MLFGYIPDKGFLSLRGIVTMAAFVMLGIYGYVTVKNGKIKQSTGFRSLITLFLKVSFVLNLFVFIFTTSTMVPRYYITIFIFALPVLCFYLEEEKMPFDRLAVTALLTVAPWNGENGDVFPDGGQERDEAPSGGIPCGERI